MTDHLKQRIEQLTEQRQLCWRRGLPVNGIAAELEECWAELRRIQAEERYGTAAEIVARARVERELEKIAVD